MLLVLSDKGKGKQSSSEQTLVGEEHCVTTLITAAKETKVHLNWKNIFIAVTNDKVKMLRLFRITYLILHQQDLL